MQPKTCVDVYVFCSHSGGASEFERFCSLFSNSLAPLVQLDPLTCIEEEMVYNGMQKSVLKCLSITAEQKDMLTFIDLCEHYWAKSFKELHLNPNNGTDLCI